MRFFTFLFSRLYSSLYGRFCWSVEHIFSVHLVELLQCRACLVQWRSAGLGIIGLWVWAPLLPTCLVFGEDTTIRKKKKKRKERKKLDCRQTTAIWTQAFRYAAWHIAQDFNRKNILKHLYTSICSYLGETLTMVAWLTMVNHGWTMVEHG